MDPGTAVGLGLSAFSTAADLLDLASKAYEVWRGIRDLDDDMELLRVKLLLQQAQFDQWRRDWYGFRITGKASIDRLRLLQAHDETVRSTARAIEQQLAKLKPIKEYAEADRKLNAAERGKWIVSQKPAAELAVRELQFLLTSLCNLLPLLSPSAKAAPMIILLSQPDQGRNPDGLPDNLELAPAARQTYELRRLEGSLTESLKRRVAQMQMALPQPRKNMAVSRVKVERDDPASAGGRSFGHLDRDTPVIVEWKKYNGTWRGAKYIELYGRIDNLAKFLGADSKPDELLTLKCLGYYDDAARSRYGFVFAYPAAMSVRSLKAILDGDEGGGGGGTPPPPSLEQRYQAAYALAMSLAVLHAAGWLHKSIRSANVLVPAPNDDAAAGPLAWARPHLVGFEYSRQDKKDALSERADHSDRFNLYRHPHAQGTPAEGFRRAFDIYSLGVVLAEIGLWESAWRIWGERCAPAAFRDRLVAAVEARLAFHMGVEYRDATLRCLRAAWDEQEGPVLEAFLVEVVEVLGRCMGGGQVTLY